MMGGAEFQRVHVGPKYILHSYVDPMGNVGVRPARILCAVAGTEFSIDLFSCAAV